VNKREDTLQIVWLVLGALGLVSAGILLVFPSERWPHHFFYNLPIAVPFVLFLRDRWQARVSWRGALRALGLGGVGVALLRPATIALGHEPFPPLVSGHALFLTYALLTTRSPLLRLFAGAVLLQVIYAKVVLWGDPSVYGGMLLGLVVAALRRRVAQPETPRVSLPKKR